MARSHAFLRYVSSESFRSLQVQVSQHETTTGEYSTGMIFRDLFEEVCRSLSGCVSTLIPPVPRSGHFLQVFYGYLDKYSKNIEIPEIPGGGVTFGASFGGPQNRAKSLSEHSSESHTVLYCTYSTYGTKVFQYMYGINFDPENFR